MTDERFVLRLSARLIGGMQIAGLDPMAKLMIGEVCISGEHKGTHLILRASGFRSEDEAAAFLPRLKRGLWSLAIEHGIAFAPLADRQSITRAEDPDAAARALAQWGGPSKEPLEPVHGLSQEGGWSIFRSGENIRYAEIGEPDLHIAKQWGQLSGTLLSAVADDSGPDERVDESFLTALDLFLSSFHERSLRARFLTLVTVLEVLAPEVPKHPVAARMIDSLHGEIDQILSELSESEILDALKELKKETAFKKGISIGQRVRRLVRDEVSIPPGELESLVSQVGKAYGFRSDMLHKGKDDQAKLVDLHEKVLRTVRMILANRVGLRNGK